MKTVPEDNPTHAAMAELTFRKEGNLYQKFFPLMKELPAPVEDPKQRDLEQWAPRAFFTRWDLIVMEDLAVQGFADIDRRVAYDFDHEVLVLEALGRFHASAWLLERERSRTEGRPTPFDELFPEISRETVFVEKPMDPVARWFEATVRGIQKTIPLISKYKSSPDLDTILKNTPKILSLAAELSKKSTKYRNVLNHGDLWANNILFRHRKGQEGSIPTNARLIDFQCVRFSPPAVDINCLVFVTSDRQMRRERGGELLRRYYDALRSALGRGGTDADDYVTWDELVAMCDEYQPIGLIAAAAYHHTNFFPLDLIKDQVTPENFENFFLGDRYEFVVESFRNDEFYREHVGADIIELVDTVILGEGSGFWKSAVESTTK